MSEKLTKIKNDLDKLIEKINGAYDISYRLCSVAINSQDIDTRRLGINLRLNDMIYDIKLNLNKIKDGLK